MRGEFDLATDVIAWAAAGARRGREENSLDNITATNAAGHTSVCRFDNARRDSVTTSEVGIGGELRNRGAEFTAYGAPARGLCLLGGITLLDAEQRRTAGGANDGRDVIGMPDLQANVGVEWDVPGVRCRTDRHRWQAYHPGFPFAGVAGVAPCGQDARTRCGMRPF